MHLNLPEAQMAGCKQVLIILPLGQNPLEVQPNQQQVHLRMQQEAPQNQQQIIVKQVQRLVMIKGNLPIFQ